MKQEDLLARNKRLPSCASQPRSLCLRYRCCPLSPWHPSGPDCFTWRLPRLSEATGADVRVAGIKLEFCAQKMK